MLDVLELEERTIVKFKPRLEILSHARNKKASYQFLPEMIAELKDNSKIPFKGRLLKTTYLIDIVHSLVLKYYFKKENRFNISSEILKEKYNGNYNYYMKYIEEKGVIKLMKNHQKGVNARIYKLNNRIFDEPIHRYWNYDNFLLKKYIKSILSVEDATKTTKGGIDKDIRLKMVDDLFYGYVNFEASMDFLDKTSDANSESFEWNKYGVESIHKKHFFNHFDLYGRMHTNFTILKSTIRKNWVLIEGEETIELDIHNSQPLFLCKMIMSSNSNIVDPAELNLFRELTSTGNFYQYILDNSNHKEKRAVKKMVYMVLFGKNNRKSKYDITFSKLFPTVHNFIKDFKQVRNDHRQLSYVLQGLESQFIFNIVIREIMTKYPHIRLITVHDSIICAKKYRQEVESIFYRKMKEHFNL